MKGAKTKTNEEEREHSHEHDLRVFRYRAYWCRKRLKGSFVNLWWDFRREAGKIRFWVEAVGIMVLIVYTAYTIKMYSANRESADAAKSAAGTATNTMNQSIDAFHLDQRAWVTLGKFKLVEEPVAGRPVKIGFSIINSGKTPAIKCTTERMPLMGAVAARRGVPEYYANSKEIWPDGSKTIGRPVFMVLPIAEQDETEPWTTEPRSTLTPKVIREYKEKTRVLYVIAKIWYDDVFGDHHWTTTCRWHEYETDKAEFWPCVGGADMDNPYLQRNR